LAHTVTLLEDHKGMTTPKVMGDEYVVDAIINITNYVQDGITITASSLGLATITQVLVTGVEEIGHSARAVIDTDGAYASDSSFLLILSTGSAQQAGTADEGTVRLRVFGLL